MYVADSESRNGEPGYGYNPGCRRGIRIGSAKDGSVKYFVPDAAPYPAAADPRRGFLARRAIYAVRRVGERSGISRSNRDLNNSFIYIDL